jgi:RecG-like helicase
MSKKIILSAFEKLSIEEKEDLLGKLVSRYTKSLEANTSGDLPQDQSDSIVNTLETENISFLEQQRKSQALQFLKDNNLETPAHIAMINNVQFTKEAIVIGGVTRAHENAKASDFGLNYTIDDENNPADYNKAHVFKGEGDYAEEDYFNYAMVDKIVKEKQAKVPTYQDMRKALAALPWGPSEGTPPSSPSSKSTW